MSNHQGVSVFIPVYNEESLLVPNTEKLMRFLDTLEIAFEIIIGSNGSTDGTVALGKELAKKTGKITQFHLPQRGVGAAFREAVRLAGYHRIITVDMDLSISLDFIREAYGLLDRYDMIIGSKITGSQQRKFIRTAASNTFITLAGHLLKINFNDYSIAAKAYRKNLAEQYLPYIDDKTFYVVEIIHRACREGKRLKEIPVSCVDMRGSRFNLLHEGLYKFGNLFLLWLKSLKQWKKINLCG